MSALTSRTPRMIARENLRHDLRLGIARRQGRHRPRFLRPRGPVQLVAERYRAWQTRGRYGTGQTLAHRQALRDRLARRSRRLRNQTHDPGRLLQELSWLAANIE